MIHDAEGPRKATAFRPADSGARAGALTPDMVLRLQRTAGTINGILTLEGKDHQLTSINITDGWLTSYP